jgi:hypothetical protein
MDANILGNVELLLKNIEDYFHDLYASGFTEDHESVKVATETLRCAINKALISQAIK